MFLWFGFFLSIDSFIHLSIPTFIYLIYIVLRLD